MTTGAQRMTAAVEERRPEADRARGGAERVTGNSDVTSFVALRAVASTSSSVVRLWRTAPANRRASS